MKEIMVTVSMFSHGSDSGLLPRGRLGEPPRDMWGPQQGGPEAVLVLGGRSQGVRQRKERGRQHPLGRGWGTGRRGRR